MAKSKQVLLKFITVTGTCECDNEKDNRKESEMRSHTHENHRVFVKFDFGWLAGVDSGWKIGRSTTMRNDSSGCRDHHHLRKELDSKDYKYR